MYIYIYPYIYIHILAAIFPKFIVSIKKLPGFQQCESYLAQKLRGFRQLIASQFCQDGSCQLGPLSRFPARFVQTWYVYILCVYTMYIYIYVILKAFRCCLIAFRCHVCSRATARNYVLANRTCRKYQSKPRVMVPLEPSSFVCFGQLFVQFLESSWRSLACLQGVMVPREPSSLRSDLVEPTRMILRCSKGILIQNYQSICETLLATWYFAKLSFENVASQYFGSMIFWQHNILEKW